MAETKEQTLQAYKDFLHLYGAKFPATYECLRKDTCPAKPIPYSFCFKLPYIKLTLYLDKLQYRILNNEIRMKKSSLPNGIIS